MELVYQMEKQLYHDKIISLGNDSNDVPEIITQIRVSFSLNQHFLKWPQIPISAMECYIFSLSSWLTIQLLGISTLITFPYNYFLSFKINLFFIFYFQYILNTLRASSK